MVTCKWRRNTGMKTNQKQKKDSMLVAKAQCFLSELLLDFITLEDVYQKYNHWASKFVSISTLSQNKYFFLHMSFL